MAKMIVLGLDEVIFGFRQAPGIFRKRRKEAFQNIIDHVVPKVQSYAPVATGTFKNAIEGRLENGGANIVIDAGDTPGVVAMSIEKGGRPHWPPWGPGTAVAAWAAMKGIEPFLVGRSIANRGTPAFAPFEKGLDDSWSFIDAELERIKPRLVRSLFK